MMLSDVSVKRPVFATVISLLLVAFGILSFRMLPLREYPDIDTPIVSVSTIYPGASSDIVETKITQLIEDEISGIEGVRSISSASRDGQSNINIEFIAGRDIDFAANDVRDRVSRVAARLPDQAEAPQISKSEADSQPIIWMSLSSSRRDGLQLTDFADRYLIDQLSTVDGISSIRIAGQRRYAMRIWLDRTKLAARGLTVSDVENVLKAENVELPAGRLETDERELSLRVARSYLSPEDFAALVLKRGDGGYLVRLGEVARVELGAEEHRNLFRANGQSTLGLGVVKQSKANTLEVARNVRARVDQITKTLPEDLKLAVASDDSVFIEQAIHEVYLTFGIAMVLVISVIYLFLGSLRATLIPAVTVPVCITASFMVLAAFGYSVNLVTLLALVLAIGLVVDDSIIVLENIHRRMERGEPPLVAAYNGARQVGMAVVATTLVLIAVFVPIMFLEGTTGRVFTELAVALGGAVGLSGIVALSLTPMMCSKIMKPSTDGYGRLSRMVDGLFLRVSAVYADSLRKVLARPKWLVMGMVAVLVLIAGLLKIVPQEFAPTEDRGKFTVMVTAAEGTSYDAMIRNMAAVENVLSVLSTEGLANRTLVRIPGYGSADQFNTGLGVVNLVDWGARNETADQVMTRLGPALRQIADVTAFPVMFGGLKTIGGGRGQPVQFVIGGDSYTELAAWRDSMLAALATYPGLRGLEADLKETKPQILITIDQNRAADLGVSIGNIGRTLETMFNSRRVTTFVDRGKEYYVMLQAGTEDRRSPNDMTDIYVRSDKSGVLVPLSSLVRFEERGTAASLSRFNRLRSVTLSANITPGYSMGEVIQHLEATAAKELPQTARIDYKGESREFKESSSSLLFIFGMALVVVFLVLAAQFESFVHPTVIMLTVPLALAGALIGLFITGQSLNVYSEIGIVMLVGISAKNGILIVEFTNQLRDEGRAFGDAIVEACQIRLRPILMTSIATTMGAVPLIFAGGAGAESRVILGIVIFFGVTFATAFTLFVVPVFYQLLARGTTSPNHVAQELESLLKPGVAE
ncbi:efflux RND transporter permease subunit [Govanella unica]|uniref:Efflux RND transporter permease subunit n=1 Tax=Govanella unica TaxID=2975056 RepID=A0A9X3TVY1_9PROT|nr:efflux RND transporter permease subunit [Govania unica]MDA5192412.1 efflux RND transporter permease subunit [Govania unica]